MEKIKRSEKLITAKETCVDCGNVFSISIKDISRNKDKRIPLPTRCRACRRMKLIEIKLKKLIKLVFRILRQTESKNEPKLQEKQSKRNKIKEWP